MLDMDSVLYTAQHEQPSAPKNDFWSEAGTLEAHALAWLCPCMPQAVAQPQAAAKRL
ncbi:hypothetical protein D3C75_1296810 [compost metagenome]